MLACVELCFPSLRVVHFIGNSTARWFAERIFPLTPALSPRRGRIVRRAFANPERLDSTQCGMRCSLPMNLRFVAAEVTRRIPLGDNSFRLITSAATRFSAARREDGFRGILSLRERRGSGRDHPELFARLAPLNRGSWAGGRNTRSFSGSVFKAFPSPRPSPRSFLTGRGRRGSAACSPCLCRVSCGLLCISSQPSVGFLPSAMTRCSKSRGISS